MTSMGTHVVNAQTYKNEINLKKKGGGKKEKKEEDEVSLGVSLGGHAGCGARTSLSSAGWWFLGDLHYHELSSCMFTVPVPKHVSFPSFKRKA